MESDTDGSERELIGAAQAGNKASLASLILRYTPSLQAYFFIRTRDYGATEELTQETWTRLCEGLDKFDIARDFKPWLKGIAWRVLSEHGKEAYARRSRPLQVIEDRLQYEIERDLDAVPEPLLLLHGTSLNSCLSTLPEEERTLVDQHYRQSVPIVQLAKQCARPPGALRVWLFRIRGKLRACLDRKARHTPPGVE